MTSECQNCVMWYRIGRQEVGECRKDAPSAHIFPRTESHDWCVAFHSERRPVCECCGVPLTSVAIDAGRSECFKCYARNQD